MATIKITKKMYGWSKYGGARKGLAKEQLDEWYCQVCGNKQVKSCPSYFIEEDSTGREYMRICSSCLSKALGLKLQTYDQLLALKVANLLTLPAPF